MSSTAPKQQTKQAPAAEAAPVLRIYEVSGQFTPRRLVEAFNTVDAKRRYCDMYSLAHSRPIVVVEPDNANTGG